MTMGDDSGGNTAQVFTDVADGAVVQLQRREPRAYHVAIVMDATISRAATIQEARTAFRAQMARLDQVVQNLGSVEKLHITLATFGGNKEPKIDGPFLAHEVADAFDLIECEPGLTHIGETLKRLKGVSALVPGNSKIDAALFIGDTADSGRNDQTRLKSWADTPERLRQIGYEFGAPVITMLDRSVGKGSDVTQAADVYALQCLSEGSGVMNCPIDYKSEITLVDMIAATLALQSEGQEGLNRLIEEGLINPDVKSHVSDETQVSIEKPKPQKTGRPQHIWPWAAGAMAAAGLATLAHQCATTPESAPLEPMVSRDAGEVFSSAFSDASITDPNGAFAFGTAEINPAVHPVLDRIAEQLSEIGHGCYLVTAHTDQRGSAEYNLGLSEARAQAVVDYLRTKTPAVNLTFRASGKGETELLSIDPDPGSWDLNRRVEVTACPTVEQ